MMTDRWIPLATAFRESVGRGYSRQDFRHDLTAALVVSLVALPLAMALAIAVGLPPQHGIYTAIVAGILVPLLGGSMMQVSGPTAAFVVIVAPIIAEHGLRGIIIAEIMAGMILLLLAVSKLGRFITFIPYPVTTGFTAGIAVVLATLSLNDLFGLGIVALSGSYTDKLRLLIAHAGEARWPEMLVGFISLAIMLCGKRITRKVPSVVLGIGFGALLAFYLQAYGLSVATIGSRFSYDTARGLMHGVPPFAPEFHFFGDNAMFAWPSMQELRVLLMPAFVIAALAALESLLSATVADGLSRTKHNPHAELAALGIANICSGFVQGIPATGAIARTTTNIKSGARTPLASAMHGGFILLYVLCLAPIISYIPMASLAALLIVVAYNMSHYRQFYRILKIAPMQDVIVLLACFCLTVFIDMVAGVMVGILLAVLLFIQRVSAMTEAHIAEGDSSVAKLPPNVMVYQITGPLFFATVERTLDRTAFLRRAIDTLILDMQQVPLIDMTGLVALKNLLASDALLGKRILLCAKPDIREKIARKLAGETGLNVQLTGTIDEALALL